MSVTGKPGRDRPRRAANGRGSRRHASDAGGGAVHDTRGGDDPSARDHVRPYVEIVGDRRSLHFSAEAIQTCVDLRRPDLLALEYTRLMMGFLLFHPAPRALGMIGLGGGALARFCHQWLPQARIEVAEINPHVIALRDSFAIPPDSERFQVLRVDGAHWMRASRQRFDVLLVDGYVEAGLPAHLSTPRFFDHCARALVPGGVLAMNLCVDAVRQTEVLAAIDPPFKGALVSIADTNRENLVILARKAGADEASLPLFTRAPADPQAVAWPSLRDDLGRVRAAWEAASS